LEQEKLFYEEIVNWLIESDISNEQGAVYSWTNPEKPGYIYSEIIGYYIKFFAYLYKKTNNEIYLKQAVKSADYLSNNLEQSGGVARGNVNYVFDSAICISGLIALNKITELNQNHKDALKKLTDFVYNSLKNKQVAFENKKELIDLDKWSLSYGSLLLKNCIALYELYELYEDIKYKQLAEQIADELIKTAFKQDHFTINSQRDFVYTHPHCYATEGLLFLTTKGYDFEEIIRKSADWLANNQNPDGSLYNWYSAEKELEKQGDATSQAVRIWCCVNKAKYTENIKKATSFLKTLQSKQGGLIYNQGSKDINSWVSIFTVQALLWQINEPEREWII